MKAILIVDLDDSFMVLDEDTITLEKGTIKYRDINRNPFKITIEGLKLKPMPQKNKYDVKKYATVDYENNVTLGHYLNNGWNACIDEILGETE